MNRLTVHLTDRSYTIVFSHGDLKPFAAYVRRHFHDARIFVVTNTLIERLYKDKISSALAKTGRSLKFISIPDGEKFKSLGSADRVYTRLIQNGANRSSLIVALGGGVIGDLAGFVAATYMRGVALVQMPTTLLAMVDSSIGGKVAINHPLGKNMIGAFYQPRAVFIDTAFLNTLPDREFLCGFAEVIKYGLILDRSFFEWMQTKFDRVQSLNRQAIRRTVERSCALKCRVIEKDEHERSLRMILNFGHTFGHALEGLSEFRLFKHGEAVFLGMVVAAHLSFKLKKISEADCAGIESFIKKFVIRFLTKPMRRFLGDVSESEFYQKLKSDKKVTQNSIRFIILRKIGRAGIQENVSELLVRQSIAYLNQWVNALHR